MRFDGNNIPILGVLSQVLHLAQQHAKRLFVQYDLAPWQAGILFILHRDGEMSQRKLAERLNLTPPSVTASIQKMEKLGYIRRTPKSGDQRVLLISLTEKGKTYLQGIFDVGHQMEEMAFRGMSLEEKLLLKRLLLQVRDNLMDEKTDLKF